MLLVDVEISTNCPKGSDIAKLHVGSYESVTLSNNQKERRPVYVATYTIGKPLGEGFQPVEAPIDLKPGDQLRVQAAAPQEPREVYDVTRGGKVIWPADGQGLPAEEEALQGERAEKIAARKKLL